MASERAILLDTHLLLWWVRDFTRLPSQVERILRAPDVEPYFSAASLWECSIKKALGRADFQGDTRALRDTLVMDGFLELAITSQHGIEAGELPLIHRDPFDRLLVAQANHEGLLLLTSDQILSTYPGTLLV